MHFLYFAPPKNVLRCLPSRPLYFSVLLLAMVPFSVLALDEYAREASKLSDLMNWKPGQVIAEIGAGEGQMSFFASARVGLSGHVYITELDSKKIDHLKDEVEKRKLQNATVIKADVIGTNLPDNCCDVIFMRRVYHHFTHPEQTDAAILRDLKPGGLLAVIDFSPRLWLPAVDGAPKTHGGHGVPKQVLIRELSIAGFEIVGQPKDWPNPGDYCVIARKPVIQSGSSTHTSHNDYDRPVSWKLMASNILSDQKAIWLFPTKITKDHNWIQAFSIGGATAGLFMLDPNEGRYFHQTSTFRGFNGVFTSNATTLGVVIAPLSLYAVGLARRHTKMQHTALLAGEAVLDAELVTTVLKDIDKRVRPVAFTQHANYWDSWFESKGSMLRGNGSFPSGHAIAAFSIATVIAHRYRTHSWIPYAAYGMASLVGFSRLSLSSHFTSDVFMGAVLGYSISRFAVLRY
jgi:ubiquinone/menaquinone biosynthesis C-methylase UbiE/membrane-associated phospholipid phosphatase